MGQAELGYSYVFFGLKKVIYSIWILDWWIRLEKSKYRTSFIFSNIFNHYKENLFHITTRSLRSEWESLWQFLEPFIKNDLRLDYTIIIMMRHFIVGFGTVPGSPRLVIPMLCVWIFHHIYVNKQCLMATFLKFIIILQTNYWFYDRGFWGGGGGSMMVLL